MGNDMYYEGTSYEALLDEEVGTAWSIKILTLAFEG